MPVWRFPPALMKPNNLQSKKARRFPAVRLLSIAFFCFVAALFACLFVRYILSFYRAPIVLSAQIPVEISEPSSEESTGKLNINQASFESLDALPGIGPALARAILDYRAAHGAFYYVEEIMDVSGIGEKRFEEIKALITCLPVKE